MRDDNDIFVNKMRIKKRKEKRYSDKRFDFKEDIHIKQRRFDKKKSDQVLRNLIKNCINDSDFEFDEQYD